MSYVHKCKQGLCEAVHTTVDKKADAQPLRNWPLTQPHHQDCVAVCLYRAQNFLLLPVSSSIKRGDIRVSQDCYDRGVQ